MHVMAQKVIEKVVMEFQDRVQSGMSGNFNVGHQGRPHQESDLRAKM